MARAEFAGAPGEGQYQVVIDGVDRLRDGAKILIDITSADMLAELGQTLATAGIDFHFAEV